MGIQDFVDFVKKNRHAAIIILALVVCFIVFSVYMYEINSSVRGNVDTSEQESASAQEEISEQNVLTDHQRTLIDGYGSKEKELIEYLSANVWVYEKGSCILHFSDTEFTVATTTDEKSTAFAIDALESESTDTDDGRITEFTCTIELADGSSHILKVQRSDSDPSYATVISQAFGSATSFVRSHPSETFTIEELPDIAVAMIDNKQEELKKALNDYRSFYVPSASEASCSTPMSIDWQAHTVILYFTFNNDNETTVVAIYSQTDGTFNVENASSWRYSK